MGSKPANAEKSSLAGRGTGSTRVPLRTFSVAAKVTAGVAPEVLLPMTLVAGGGAVLAFQLVSK